ncbi:MAG: chromosome segregation protein SMC [Acidobacteria bacterium]|nr:chromosome segregation protein SMC [Acidobacteriota bacterium]
MYRLERMELIGFKSFCDRTELKFPPGFTVVVGPNGCGKSNLGDALSWVLGEQSVRALRGTRMEDVIFGGTEGRRALGMAEVTVHLAQFGGGGSGSGREQAADLDMSGNGGDNGRTDATQNGTLVVSRRLFRSGESEYLMNGRRCRLRDIHDTLYGTGLGTRGYMVIEQGKVDTILSGKPRERRVLIEEAAGILGYKVKKRAAWLKLEATQSNLLRIRDLVGEVTRQINSLKRQAARARRYRRLQDEARQRNRWLFSHRLLEVEQGQQQAKLALQNLTGEETRLAVDLGRASAAAEQRERRHEEMRAELRSADESLAECSRQADLREATRERMREQESAERQRAEQLSAEAESLRAEGESLSGEAARSAIESRTLADEAQRAAAEATSLDRDFQSALRGLNESSARAEQERRSLFEAIDRASESRALSVSLEENRRSGKSRLERLMLERAGLRRDADAAQQEVKALAERGASQAEDLRHQRQALEGGRRVLREKDEERERCAHERAAVAARLQARDEFRSALAELDQEEIQGVGSSAPRIADFVHTDADVEAAVEAYAEDWLACRVDSGGWQGLRARLRPNGPRYWVPRPRQSARPPGEAAVKGARLLERMKVSGPHADAIRAELQDVMLARDASEALQIASRHADTDVVALDGTVVTRRGEVFQRQRGAPELGLLGRRRLVRETGEELESLRRTANELEAHAAGIEQALQQTRDRERQESDRLEEMGREVASLEARQAEADQRHKQIEGRARLLDGEMGNLMADLERWERELEPAREASGMGEELRRSLEASAKSAQAESESRRETLGALHTRLQEARARCAESEQRQAVQAQKSETLTGRAADLSTRSRVLENESTTCRQKTEALGREITEASAALRSALEERDTTQRARARLEQQIEELRSGSDTGQAETRRLQEELEQARNQMREHEVALARVESDRQHLEHECRQELDLALDGVRPEDGEDVPDHEICAQELADLRQKLSNLGPVNLLALEEYQELEERHQFLTGQKEDLDRSIDSLKQTIQRLNRRSRERFMHAYEQIRKNFHEMFRRLFRGGRAELRLEEGEDVLEAGLEVSVQPPGKRLQSIQLLSGGEKALSALALLFSIFRYKPSPFCLLDEVDAALDESNVERFLRIVRDFQEHTQFVLITHNKRSMEAADVLYGVTMEEPGVSKLVSVNLS